MKVTRGRRRVVVAVVVLAAAGATAGWWATHRASVPEPPAVDLAGADPEVAAAVESARAAVRREPSSGAAWGHLGMVLRAHDFGPEANACLAEAERLAPNEPRWPYLQGLTLILTDPDAGLRRLQRAVELCDNKPLAPRLRLAETLLAQGRLDEAEEQLRRARAAEPGHPRVRLALGRLAYQRDDLAGSRNHLQAAADSPFGRKTARSLLAAVRQRLGDPGAADEAARAARLPDDPPWPDPFVEEVEELGASKQAAIARADSLFFQGRGGEAVALLSQAVRRYPDADRVWLALGRILVQLKDDAAAVPALRRTTELAPDSSEGWFQLGVALYRLENVDEAADCFRQAVRLKPDYAWAHHNLGLCRKRQGDRAGAAECFRAALRYKPDYVPAREELEALTAAERPAP